jgi:hypothetical protein
MNTLTNRLLALPLLLLPTHSFSQRQATTSILLLPLALQQQQARPILPIAVVMQQQQPQQAATPILFQPLVWRQHQATFPQSSQLVDSSAVRDAWRKAYKGFKPPAAIASKMEELKRRQNEALERWSVGALDQAAMSREFDRNAIHRHLLMCLALVAGEKGTVPDLVVVQANSREIQKVFPSGKLPADPLQPNTVYETEPGSAREVRYLTLYKWSPFGARFAVFAREAP